MLTLYKPPVEVRYHDSETQCLCWWFLSQIKKKLNQLKTCKRFRSNVLFCHHDVLSINSRINSDMGHVVSKLGHCLKSKGYLVNALEAAFWIQNLSWSRVDDFLVEIRYGWPDVKNNMTLLNLRKTCWHSIGGIFKLEAIILIRSHIFTENYYFN